MTITIKNVPRSLHLALKRQAKANKRSLNQDVIKYLEERTEATERQKAFAEAINYRNEAERRGGKASKRLDPVKIIRELRDHR